MNTENKDTKSNDAIKELLTVKLPTSFASVTMPAFGNSRQHLLRALSFLVYSTKMLLASIVECLAAIIFCVLGCVLVFLDLLVVVVVFSIPILIGYLLYRLLLQI